MVRQTGHLVELPLTDGSRSSIDPSEVCEVATPRGQRGVTLVRCRGERFALYVAGDYETILAILRAAMGTS